MLGAADALRTLQGAAGQGCSFCKVPFCLETCGKVVPAGEGREETLTLRKCQIAQPDVRLRGTLDLPRSDEMRIVSMLDRGKTDDG